MKKFVPLVFAFFSLFSAVFAEIAFSPNFSLSPSVDFRIGFLLYEPNESIWYHTEGAHIVARTKIGDFCAGGRYFFGKSSREDFCGKLKAGAADFSFSRDFYNFRFGFGSFSIPDELKILDGKPQFVLSDFDGNFLTFGGDFHFSIFDEDFSLKTDAIFSKAGFESGDMYYFYGHPTDFSLFGGKTSFSVPFGFEIFSLGGNLSFDIDTNSDESLGKAKSSLVSVFLAKRFDLPFGEESFVKPFAGYANLHASGDGKATSENQRYFLFPYKYAYGDIDERVHFVSAGTSAFFRSGGFDFSLDFVYFFCVKNSASANYGYKYKKNLLFDGSSDEGIFALPDGSGTHLFAGKAEVAYKFTAHKHFSPSLRLTKLFAAVILSESVKDYFDDDDGTYSSDFTPSSPTSDSGDSGFKEFFDTFKKVLLSGTSISVKIEG